MTFSSTKNIIPPILASLALFTNNAALAKYSPQALDADNVWTFSGRLSSVSLDSKTAQSQGIEDSASAFAFYANYHKEQWLTSLGIGYLEYNDFRQNTSQNSAETELFNNGNRSRESSDASAIIWTLATGPKMHFGSKSQHIAYGQLGYTFVTHSERKVGNYLVDNQHLPISNANNSGRNTPYCIDCYSEDIDIANGAFIRIGTKTRLGLVTLGLEYNQYLSGDGLDNMLSITLGSRY